MKYISIPKPNEWISNFIPYFIIDVITYPYWYLKLKHVGKRGPWIPML